MAQRFKSFAEFWPFYVGEHTKPLTRILHFIGIAALFPITGLAIFYSGYFFIALPIVAYGFAWYGHYFVEKNRPATFQYPLWSALGDFKMFFLMCTGKMNDQVLRCRELRKKC